MPKHGALCLYPCSHLCVTHTHTHTLLPSLFLFLLRSDCGEYFYMSALQDGWPTSATKSRWAYYLRHQTITSTHTYGKSTLDQSPGLKQPAKTWPSSHDHDHPHGHGWHLARHVCVCMCALRGVLHHARLWPCFPVCQSWLACLLSVCVYTVSVYHWHEEQMPQGVWAASEGPVCPQSLAICALLVVIKVSNLEVSWGLAKRGQKMSLRCFSCWAAVTIFTYLYTLIVFALLPWHWGSQSLVWDGEREREEKVRRTQWEDSVTHSRIEFGPKVNLN